MTHSHEPRSTTTVVEDRSGMSVLAIIMIVLLVAFLIWLFAFSDLVFDRGGDDGEDQDVRIENNEDTDVINPPADTDNDTNTDTDTDQNQPAPGNSP